MNMDLTPSDNTLRIVGAAVRILNIQAYQSVLKDYDEVCPADLGTIISGLSGLGFTFVDLRNEPDPEHQGVLIVRGEGDNLEAIALVSPVRVSSNALLEIAVHRLDEEDCHSYTFEIKRVSTWN